MKCLGRYPNGAAHTLILSEIFRLNVDTSHFDVGEFQRIGELGSTPETAKRIILKERGHSCESCGITSWMGIPAPLDLHHIRGKKEGNTRENVILLCPNCHAQTHNYRGRQKRKGK
jgi:5-methylcytosine-specific restriction endonuclease McrA